MRKGFTIIELLVASLLLGMLVTILTMIFNQSSIAWRTGAAGVVDMDDIRDNMAEVCEEADNAFIHGRQVYRHVGLWDRQGRLRDRACDAPGSQVMNEDGGKYRANILRQKLNANNTRPDDFDLISVGNAKKAGSIKSYTVNVMSAGPNREFGDYDDIWSNPDVFD
jgi:prepilin-type N-terminal cleavage/methylation domain-containing protein